MCGICGLIARNGTTLDPKDVERMTAAIRHRGPDDEGYVFVDAARGKAAAFKGDDSVPEISLPHLKTLAGQDFAVGFGFRRLSILDLSAAGHQPMASEDGRRWIVFNGEVYNYVELRAELETKGFRFRSGSDTEVVLAAYCHWGPDCLNRFRGMWSLCIIDLDEQVIFAARDPFGIKPFYYTARNGRFAFASELKSLLALPWVERNVNPQTVWDYLQVGRTGDRNDSIVQGIAQLPHAHYMTISLNDQGAPSVRRYWDIDISRDSALSREEAVQRVREGFLANVIQHLRSDVAVAATLSGGIDSSAIVSSIRHLLPDDQLINTFSFVTDDPTISEEPFMRAVAEAKGAKIHCVTPTANELVSDLDNLIRTQDEPFGSTTIYAQYRVFGIIQQAGIKVVLDGQGADEMLGGYRGYLLNRCASLIRSGKPVNLIRLLWNISRFTSLSEGIGAHWGRALKQALQYPDDAPPLPVVVANSAGAAWLNGAYFHERNVVSGPQQPPPRTKNVLRERLKQSLMETSLPELLRFEDRNSMGHSIESRVPFLTTDFVELVLSLPEEFLIDNRGESKSVFRSAMRGLVPDVVLDRRDKIGFDTPEQAWLSTLDPWVTDVLGNADQNRFTALELSAMRREWSQVQAGNRPYTKRYWRWINLIRWAEIFDMSFA